MDWPTDVEWPVRPCADLRGTHLPDCAPAICARWLSPGADYAAALARHKNVTDCGHTPSGCTNVRAISYRGKQSTGSLLQGRPPNAVHKRVAKACDGRSCGSGAAAAKVDVEALAAWRDNALGVAVRGREQIQPSHHRWIEVIRANDLAYGFGQKHKQNEGHGNYGCWFFYALGAAAC